MELTVVARNMHKEFIPIILAELRLRYILKLQLHCITIALSTQEWAAALQYQVRPV
jgi:hypothetical protein